MSERIPAILLASEAIDHALLAEIDENLIRADLSPAESAAHHARRKEIYELHPETKRGGAPGKAGGGKKNREKGQSGG